MSTKIKIVLMLLCFLIDGAMMAHEDLFLQTMMYKNSERETTMSRSEFASLWTRLQTGGGQPLRTDTGCETNETCAFVQKCLDADAAWRSFADSPDAATLDITSFERFCPALLYQAESGVCLGHEGGSTGPRPSKGETWGLGILCVFIISVASLAGAALLPVMKKSFYKKLLTFLVALAVGCLSGSAVFHLLPQAFRLDVTDLHHTYLYKSLMCVAGVYLFFVTEHLLKILAHRREHRHKMGGTTTTMPSVRTISHTAKTNNVKFQNGGLYGESKQNGGVHANSEKEPLSEPLTSQQAPQHDTEVEMENGGSPVVLCGHNHTRDATDFLQADTTPRRVAAVAWMIILGDGLHNFIDGLGIGAAFTESTLSGISISLAVFFEEFPHELGDFAILLNAGMSLKQAMFFNFMSACTCFLGLAVGILIGEALESSTFFIFALAAGMFLYISLADMIPEVNEAVKDAIEAGRGLKTLLLVNSGLLIGLALMFISAMYASRIVL